jgi:hypothetical protein
VAAHQLQHLKMRASPGVVWFHVGNEGAHCAAYRVKQKRLGVKAGAADLILLPLEKLRLGAENHNRPCRGRPHR